MARATMTDERAKISLRVPKPIFNTLIGFAWVTGASAGFERQAPRGIYIFALEDVLAEEAAAMRFLNSCDGMPIRT